MESDDHPDTLNDLPGVREAGLDLSLWGWLYYASSSQHEPRSSWGSELELDATKTFFNRVSLAADVEFVDYDDEARGDFEQLFTSILLSPDNGTLLTLGKFNSPFGAEKRDFWDRYTGTPSLLFRAQPEDLRGALLTAPLGKTNITLRPFIVSGFDDDTSVPSHPAVGLQIEYQPNDQFNLGVTNWIGPGLWRRDNWSAEWYDNQSGEYSAGYADSVYGLTDEWNLPNYRSARSGSLYFFNINATWKPTPGLTFVAEYLLATGQGDVELSYWDGVMLLGNYDLDEHWHVFAQWSFLDDATGTITGDEQRLQEVDGGFGYHFDTHWEFRSEYRHDFSDEQAGADSVWVHLTFGY